MSYCWIILHSRQDALSEVPPSSHVTACYFYAPFRVEAPASLALAHLPRYCTQLQSGIVWLHQEAPAALLPPHIHTQHTSSKWEFFPPIDKTFTLFSLFYTFCSIPQSLYLLSKTFCLYLPSSCLYLSSFPLLFCNIKIKETLGLFVFSLPHPSGAVNAKSIIFLKEGKGKGTIKRKKKVYLSKILCYSFFVFLILHCSEFNLPVWSVCYWVSDGLQPVKCTHFFLLLAKIKIPLQLGNFVIHKSFSTVVFSTFPSSLCCWGQRYTHLSVVVA